MSALRVRVAGLLPEPVAEPAARAFRRGRAVAMRGDAVGCPCCGGSFRSFLPNHNGRRAVCPGCGSLERHRLLWLWLRPRVAAAEPPVRVLHVAPEPAIRAGLLDAPGVEYVSVDLFSREAMLRADVEDLPFRDGRFGIVLCNHVLEHVTDDGAALRELRRVTAPSGFAVLQTPWDPRLDRTDEDPSVTDPAERLRRWGQDDHLRSYGADFPGRIEAADFSVDLDGLAATLAPDVVARMGLDAGEQIVVATPR